MSSQSGPFSVPLTPPATPTSVPRHTCVRRRPSFARQNQAQPTSLASLLAARHPYVVLVCGVFCSCCLCCLWCVRVCLWAPLASAHKPARNTTDRIFFGCALKTWCESRRALPFCSHSPRTPSLSPSPYLCTLHRSFVVHLPSLCVCCSVDDTLSDEVSFGAVRTGVPSPHLSVSSESVRAESVPPSPSQTQRVHTLADSELGSVVPETPPSSPTQPLPERSAEVQRQSVDLDPHEHMQTTSGEARRDELPPRPAEVRAREPSLPPESPTVPRSDSVSPARASRKASTARRESSRSTHSPTEKSLQTTTTTYSPTESPTLSLPRSPTPLATQTRRRTRSPARPSLAILFQVRVFFFFL